MSWTHRASSCGQENSEAVEPQPHQPPSPHPPRQGNLRKVWAVAGIVAGLLFFIAPGVFALRSYRRWRTGSIHRPTFAWACAWIGVPLLSLGAYSAWALYNVPVLQDDFSDSASGWPVNAGPGWSVGYNEGAYRIELHGADSKAAFLTWREGALPNVAVEADVMLQSGNEATSLAGVGCSVEEGVGYLFVIGFHDKFAIIRFDEAGTTTIATGDLPPTVWIAGSTSRIRGECRAGFGEARLTMYVNGTKLEEATEPDEGDYRAFRAIRLAVASSAEDTVDIRFDNAFVIGIQPS